MAKPDLGMKRKCLECGAPFFDLNKKKIECPKCGAAFNPAPPARPKRPPPAPAKKPAPEAGAVAEEKVDAGKIDAAEKATEDEALVKAGKDDKKDDGALDVDGLNAEVLDDDDDNDDLIEDTSDLGEDDDDMSEVKEHIDDGVEDKN